MPGRNSGGGLSLAGTHGEHVLAVVVTRAVSIAGSRHKLIRLLIDSVTHLSGRNGTATVTLDGNVLICGRPIVADWTRGRLCLARVSSLAD